MEWTISTSTVGRYLVHSQSCRPSPPFLRLSSPPKKIPVALVVTLHSQQPLLTSPIQSNPSVNTRSQGPSFTKKDTWGLHIRTWAAQKKNWEATKITVRGFPGGSYGEESACSAGDPGSIPGSGRSPGEGNGNPLTSGRTIRATGFQIKGSYEVTELNKEQKIQARPQNIEYFHMKRFCWRTLKKRDICIYLWGSSAKEGGRDHRMQSSSSGILWCMRPACVCVCVSAWVRIHTHTITESASLLTVWETVCSSWLGSWTRSLPSPLSLSSTLVGHFPTVSHMTWG